MFLVWAIIIDLFWWAAGAVILLDRGWWAAKKPEPGRVESSPQLMQV